MVVSIIYNQEGSLKKSAFEQMYFAALIAKSMEVSCAGVVLGNSNNTNVLSEYGASQILVNKDPSVVNLDSAAISKSLANLDIIKQAKCVVFGHNAFGKTIAGALAARLDSGLTTSVTGFENNAGGLSFTKSVFSGKASAHFYTQSDKSVITFAQNSIQIQDDLKTQASPGEMTISWVVPKVVEIEKQVVSEKLPLTEAEIVVSAGRGLKEPGNWNIIEELADTLNAATACSRPVADVGWRPHHEHVGQTGTAIRPNLYFAIGISGAIQHLAGVNNSKTIVVINKDAEAPFFKAADYGVCGDLFEIVPKLTAAIKAFKQQQ